MEAIILIAGPLAVGAAAVLAAAYLFWRYYWFWRNPPRTVVAGDHVLAPADGAVVYVKRAAANEPILSCKEGKSFSINDIAREDLGQAKILIGVFMSPFDVHHNRCPISGTLEDTKEYPAVGRNLHMGSMHWRCLLHKLPIYANSPHIVQNNRRVTRFRGTLKGQEIRCYVVQIGGGSVHGIDVYPQIGQAVQQGAVFGMIRVGSQVDLIVPDLPGLRIQVSPGDRVVAGESILIA